MFFNLFFKQQFQNPLKEGRGTHSLLTWGLNTTPLDPFRTPGVFTVIAFPTTNGKGFEMFPMEMDCLGFQLPSSFAPSEGHRDLQLPE